MKFQRPLPLLLFPALLILIFPLEDSHAGTVTKLNAGSVQTKLGFGITLNKGSTLRREWIAFHADLPLEFTGTPGVQTIYKSKQYRGDYNYTSQATLKASQDVTAFEVRFVMFDVFGERMTTLSATEVIDISAGQLEQFDWSWNAFRENDVGRYLASIAFIALVRTSDGQVHRADMTEVLGVVSQYAQDVTEADLEPKADKP